MFKQLKPTVNKTLLQKYITQHSSITWQGILYAETCTPFLQKDDIVCDLQTRADVFWTVFIFSATNIIVTSRLSFEVVFIICYKLYK